MNKNIAKWYEEHAKEVIGLSDEIWKKPESAMEEYFACEVTAKFMRSHGFEVTEIDAKNEGGTPNAVVASFGSGKPVIGILGELDALNGLGQDAVPHHSPISEPGHGCGHNLCCASGAGAALKAAMEAENLPGTVIYIGCPGEETNEGKVYLARDGYFDNMDLCMIWHPQQGPLYMLEDSYQANTNMMFNFYGKTSHAAVAPELGRSALDAAELMNTGVQYLREHVTDDVRIHYVYTSGGEKPNIVPDFAQLHYYIRAANRETDNEIVQRVKDVAEGAAKMTGTTTDWKLNIACYDISVNYTLNDFVYRSALKVPDIEWDKNDYAFAKELYKNTMGEEPEQEVIYTGVRKPTRVTRHIGGSTDVGDVSYIVPTCHLLGLGMIDKTPIHHWNVTACAGNSIGHKAEIYGGTVMAQCGYDALKNPEQIKKMWEEFYETQKKVGHYKCLI